MAEFLSVCNWGQHQHYKERRPVWIKLHLSTLTNYDVTYHLEPWERWCLVGLWMLAGETDNRIPADPNWLRARLVIDQDPPLAKLQALGFIDLGESASKLLAERYQNAMPRREEKRREEKKQREQSGKEKKTRLPGDWEPTDEHRERATAAGLDVEREAAKFRAHAEANDRRQVRWNASFTTWLMNAEEWSRGNPTTNGHAPRKAGRILLD